MSGSKKGRKLRPYRTGSAVGGSAHVLVMSAEDIANDAWEYAPTTRELLEREIESVTTCPGDANAQ